MKFNNSDYKLILPEAKIREGKHGAIPVMNENDFIIMIGRRIRNARMKRGYSQQDVAGMLFLHRSTIDNWEHGRRYPSTTDLANLSSILDINLDYFIGRGDYVKDDLESEGKVLQDPYNPFVLHCMSVTNSQDLTKLINRTIARPSEQTPLNDAKSTLLAAILLLLDQPSALDDLYSKQEIERFILERYGVEVDIESVSSLEHIDGQMIAQARKAKANELMSAVEHSIFDNTFFPKEIQEGIQKRLDDLADYLRKSGYAQSSMEAKADFADHAQEYDPDADFEIPDGEMYQDGFDDGVKDATPDDHDWDDQ